MMTFIGFYKPQFQPGPTKHSKNEKTRKIATFWAQKLNIPADCRKIAAVDSNKHDWDWTNRIYWKKKIFVQKYFLSPIYFDGIS